MAKKGDDKPQPRPEPHPLDGPMSDWSQAVANHLAAMRESVGMMHHENQRAMNDLRGEVKTNRTEVQASIRQLDVKISDHIVKDETALDEIRTTLGKQPSTEQVKGLLGLLGIYTAWQGARTVTKWFVAGFVILAGVMSALALIVVIVLWATGKGPPPHIQIGEIEIAPVVKAQPPERQLEPATARTVADEIGRR